MNELDLFEYYWLNQNTYYFGYNRNGEKAPLTEVMEDYKNKRNKLAEEYVVKETILNKTTMIETHAETLAKEITKNLIDTGLIK